MLIREALGQAVTRLRDQGVESPRLDAELLLAHVLDVNRAALFTWPDRQLTPKELTRFRALVVRRAEREPLAYIVGHREFFGLDLVVNHHVLIPRPETELLVEHLLRLARRIDVPQRIADVGAGSGAIAVAVAVHLPRALVYALDESAETLAVTAENVHRCGASQRVRCLHGDMLDPLPETVDLIAANLPYVTTGEWEGLLPEIREHEPRAALDGGPDGLDPIRRLLATATPHLRPAGTILLEIGASQGPAAIALARRYLSGASVELYQDYAGLDRLVVVETGAEGPQ